MGIKIISILFAFILTSVYCEEKHSIVSELLASKYTGFVKLLEQANLLDELDAQASKHQGLTILPTTDNYLVNKISPVLLSWLKKEQNVPTLRRVLLNHFIPGHAYPAKWTGNEKTLVGHHINRRVVEGVEYLGGVAVKKVSALIAPDGVAHSLDGFLVPDDVKAELAAFLDIKPDDAFERSFVGREYVKLTMDAETPMSHPIPPPPHVHDPSMSPGMPPSDMPSADTPSADMPSGDSPSGSAPSIPNSPEPSTAPPIPQSTTPLSAPAPAPSAALLDDLINALNDAGNFTFFLALIKEYGIESDLVLQLEKDTTILVPNDFAFKSVSTSDLDSLKSAGSIDELIFYHILPTLVTLDGFKNGTNSISSDSSFKATVSSATYQYETLYKGHNILVRVIDDVVTFGPTNGSATLPDLLTSSKLSVSGIDSVMIPDDLLMKAAAPSNSGYLSVNKILSAALLGFAVFVAYF